MPSSILIAGLLRRLDQSQPLVQWRACLSASAKRINVNRRGCQPTDPGANTCPTLEESNNKSCRVAMSTLQIVRRFVQPFRGRDCLVCRSVGCTRSYSRCSLSANGWVSLQPRRSVLPLAVQPSFSILHPRPNNVFSAHPRTSPTPRAIPIARLGARRIRSRPSGATTLAKPIPKPSLFL